MPSHIFRQIGRYADASKSNEDAISADEDYITQCHAQGVYPLAYYPHNIHFFWDSATMEGRKQAAIAAALKTASKIPEGAWREVPLVHQFLVTPLWAYTRFGEWDLILKEPRPPEDSPYWIGVWSYARGLAFTATGKLDAAEQELDRLRRIATEKSLDGYRVTFSRNGANDSRYRHRGPRRRIVRPGRLRPSHCTASPGCSPARQSHLHGTARLACAGGTVGRRIAGGRKSGGASFTGQD
jgi:hypothetical protein